MPVGTDGTVEAGYHGRISDNHPVFAPKSTKRKARNHSDYRLFGLWQGLKDSNPRHAVLETAALPTELNPYIWWAFRDSNPGPTGYEPVALTN